MQNKIYKRIVTDEIVKYIEDDNIIVLHGARQVGKTHILYYLDQFLKKQGKDTYYIDLEDRRYTQILNAGVDQFINLLREEGKKTVQNGIGKSIFVLIDEIQYLDDPSSFLKLTVDHHKEIKLIVSGSSTFEIKSKFKDTLAGRTVNFEIFGLSFDEVLTFKDYYFDKQQAPTVKKLGELIGLFKEYALYGGYPKVVLTREVEKKEKYLQQIIDTYVRKDVRDLANVKDIAKFNKLLETLAAQSGNLLNITELANTCQISKQTIENYLFILENTYIIKLVRPFHRNIRSELFKTPKVYFYDSGLMQLLWLKNFQKEIIGNVFETAIFSELIKKYSKEAVYYWRTMDKKEIDFILNSKNQLFPIEAKLNFERFNPTAINYFNDEYQPSDYKVTGLFGESKNKHYTYPWML